MFKDRYLVSSLRTINIINMKCEVSVYSSDCDNNYNKIEEIITYTENQEIETLSDNRSTKKTKQEQTKPNNLINLPTISKTSNMMIDNDVKINLSIHNDNIKNKEKYDNADDDDDDEEEEDVNFYHYKNSNNRNLLNSINSNSNNDSGLEDENSNDENDRGNNKYKKIVIKQIKKRRRIYGEEYSILNSFNVKPCGKLLKIDPTKVEDGSEPSTTSIIPSAAATTSSPPSSSSSSTATTTTANTAIPTNNSLVGVASKFSQPNNNSNNNNNNRIEAIPTPTKRRYVVIDIDFDDIPTPCKDCFAIECHCNILNKHVPYI